MEEFKNFKDLKNGTEENEGGLYIIFKTKEEEKKEKEIKEKFEKYNSGEIDKLEKQLNKLKELKAFRENMKVPNENLLEYLEKLEQCSKIPEEDKEFEDFLNNIEYISNLKKLEEEEKELNKQKEYKKIFEEINSTEGNKLKSDILVNLWNNKKEWLKSHRNEFEKFLSMITGTEYVSDIESDKYLGFTIDFLSDNKFYDDFYDYLDHDFEIVQKNILGPQNCFFYRQKIINIINCNNELSHVYDIQSTKEEFEKFLESLKSKTVDMDDLKNKFKKIINEFLSNKVNENNIQDYIYKGFVKIQDDLKLGNQDDLELEKKIMEIVFSKYESGINLSDLKKKILWKKYKKNKKLKKAVSFFSKIGSEEGAEIAQILELVDLMSTRKRFDKKNKSSREKDIKRIIELLESLHPELKDKNLSKSDLDSLEIRGMLLNDFNKFYKIKFIAKGNANSGNGEQATYIKLLNDLPLYQDTANEVYKKNAENSNIIFPKILKCQDGTEKYNKKDFIKNILGLEEDDFGKQTGSFKVAYVSGKGHAGCLIIDTSKKYNEIIEAKSGGLYLIDSSGAFEKGRMGLFPEDIEVVNDEKYQQNGTCWANALFALNEIAKYSSLDGLFRKEKSIVKKSILNKIKIGINSNFGNKFSYGGELIDLESIEVIEDPAFKNSKESDSEENSQTSTRIENNKSRIKVLFKAKQAFNKPDSLIKLLEKILSYNKALKKCNEQSEELDKLEKLKVKMDKLNIDVQEVAKEDLLKYDGNKFYFSAEEDGKEKYYCIAPKSDHEITEDDLRKLYNANAMSDKYEKRSGKKIDTSGTEIPEELLIAILKKSIKDGKLIGEKEFYENQKILSLKDKKIIKNGEVINISLYNLLGRISEIIQNLSNENLTDENIIKASNSCYKCLLLSKTKSQDQGLSK